jgi:glycosyltransferase involved in cell wall biosynthesis
MIGARMAATEEPRPEERRSRRRIAVVIPCFNEDPTIADVVAHFRSELPEAAIYVFDNNSTDATVTRGRDAGAHVRSELRRGKGYVVQSMFRDVDADVYVIVDGDDTYPASAVHQLIGPILAGEADMVVGSRLHAHSRSEFNPVNRWGNRLVRALLRLIFGVRLTDVLSGYRAFDRRFVKNLALFGGGFEIETELTIKAVARGYRILEVPVNLTARPAGSHSKIHLLRDGMLIVTTILTLFRDYKPLTFFGSCGLLLMLIAVVPGSNVIAGDAATDLAHRLVAAILAVVIAFGGMLLIAIGLLLHSIARRSQEQDYQLQMLSDELRREHPSARE